MLSGFNNPAATALCLFAYTEGPGKEVLIFEGRTEGRIVEARGPTHFGWDAIFEPKGFSQTYAEMESETKNQISHRGKALEALRAHFS